MNPRLIVIDGKTYNGVDEMPPDIRAQYEEAMRNANRDSRSTLNPDNIDPFAARSGDEIPDVFGNAATVQAAGGNVMNAGKFIVDGQTYDSLDQLPPEARAKYEQAMGKLDANRNGIPDFVEGMFNIPAQTTNTSVASSDIAAPGHAQSPQHAQHKPRLATSTIEPEPTGNWLLILAGLALAGLCLAAAAAGVWYFFFR